MKEKKKCRLKSYSVVFDTDSDTTIVVSEFLETDRGSEIGIVGNITSEEFLPLAPTSDMVGHPRDNGPENERPEKEHKKDFHNDSVSQVFFIATRERRYFLSYNHVKNVLARKYDGKFKKIGYTPRRSDKYLQQVSYLFLLKNAPTSGIISRTNSVSHYV